MNALERWKWRKAAYEAYLEANGDIEKAEQILRGKYASIDPATLLLILEFAMKLFAWWRDRKQSEPSAVAEMGEPGTEEAD